MEKEKREQERRTVKAGRDQGASGGEDRELGEIRRQGDDIMEKIDRAIKSVEGKSLEAFKQMGGE